MSNDRSAGWFRPLDFVRGSWRGEERLCEVFWCGGLASLCVTLVSFFAALVCGMICLGPISIVFHVSPGRAFEIVASVVFLSGFGVAAIWWLVSVWRCAPNSAGRLWSVAARGIVLADTAVAGLLVLV